MSAKILVTGDVVLDVNLYKGGRMTPDSEEVGTRRIKRPGGATIAHSLLRRPAGLKPDPRAKEGAFEAGDVVLSIQEPASWPEGFHASTFWEAVEVEAAKKKKKRWFPAKPQLGYGTAEVSAMASEYLAATIDGLNKVLLHILDPGDRRRDADFPQPAHHPCRRAKYVTDLCRLEPQSGTISLLSAQDVAGRRLPSRRHCAHHLMVGAKKYTGSPGILNVAQVPTMRFWL